MATTRTRAARPSAGAAAPARTYDYDYPVDEDCDFVALYAALEEVTDPFPFDKDADVTAQALDAGFLSRSFLLHDIGVPNAVDTLSRRILEGETDLCDDQLADALECRRRRAVLGEQPTFAAVASVAATALGISSPMAAGVTPNTSVAAMRTELQRDFIDIACGESQQVDCAQNRFLSLRARYLGEFATSLTDGARLTLRKAAVALDRDTVILGVPSVVRTYGTACIDGEEPLSVALNILGRPRREQVVAQQRLALVGEFNRLVALEAAPTAADVADFVGAYTMATPRPTCNSGCGPKGSDWSMIGSGSA
jgi:hypothetical protein